MTTCACIKPDHFFVEVGFTNCEVLTLEDMSTWVGKDGLPIPPNYNINVELKERNLSKNISLPSNSKLSLHSNELFTVEGYNCFPDGIYCITTESCGRSLKINRAYTCGVESRLNELIYKFAQDDMHSERRKIIHDLKLKIKAIHLTSEMGNVHQANDLFDDVKRILNEYHCDNC